MHSEKFRVSQAAAASINRAKADGRRVVAVGTTVVRVLEALAASPEGIRACDESTDIFIYPGHEFLAIDAMITNFHLPRSTLLMLAAAFSGQETLNQAYSEAIRQRLRFYSYGDAMLIE